MISRFAETRDLPTLARIHVDTWRAAYRGSMSQAALDGLDASHALVRLEPVVQASPPLVYVVDLDEAVVAFCRFGPSREGDVPPNTLEIYALNVTPTHWRRGVGRFLVEAVLLEAQARAYQTCTLWTLTDNARARSFYEALGFELDSATRTEAAHTDHPLHEVRYRIAL